MAASVGWYAQLETAVGSATRLPAATLEVWAKAILMEMLNCPDSRRTVFNAIAISGIEEGFVAALAESFPEFWPRLDFDDPSECSRRTILYLQNHVNDFSIVDHSHLWLDIDEEDSDERAW
ncbi:MAG: hypothetical protein KDA80_23125 [Planctomycetaceae bacterium]|nr:hypothetical protein [Planctomycetaceae bacterium]